MIDWGATAFVIVLSVLFYAFDKFKNQKESGGEIGADRDLLDMASGHDAHHDTDAHDFGDHDFGGHD
jgi:hypothetical protein